MKKLDTMNNINSNFVALSEGELQELEGGALPAIFLAVKAYAVAHPFITGAATGAVAAVGTAVAGAFRK